MKNKKKEQAQKDFMENIGAILTEASAMAALKAATNEAKPAEQPKVLQPAIVFRKNIAPDVQTIIESREDPDYQVKFVRTNPNEETHEFIPEVKVANTYSDSALNRILTIGANPAYREIIETNADKTCVKSVLKLRKDAAAAASNKLKTVVEQNVNYAIADTIGCVAAFIYRAYNNTDAATMIKDIFSLSSDNSWGRLYEFPFIYANDEYVDAIGDAIKTEDNDVFDNACILIYNDIVSNIFNSISTTTASVTSIFTNIMYSPNSNMDINDAAHAISLFTDTLNMAMISVSDVIQNNAYSYLNDLILIAQTLYGNADFSKKIAYAYSCDGCEF